MYERFDNKELHYVIACFAFHLANFRINTRSKVNTITEDNIKRSRFWKSNKHGINRTPDRNETKQIMEGMVIFGFVTQINDIYRFEPQRTIEILEEMK
jgi:hypothetical protein